jgi:hypothetical protein
MMCCSHTQTLLDDAGVAGLSLVAGRHDELRAFFLQSRACNFDEALGLKELPLASTRVKTIRVVMQVAIKHCPFCGSLLQDVIRTCVQDFDKLADRHQPYFQ